MALRGNFTHGRIMTRDPKTRGGCVCNGQFSEAKACRKFKCYFDETLQPREMPGKGICLNASFVLGKLSMAPWLRHRGEVDPGGSIEWDPAECARDDYRRILLVL